MRFVLSVFLLLVSSCSFSHELAFEKKFYEKTYGKNDGDSSPFARVSLVIPQAVDGESGVVEQVNEELIRFSDEKIALFLPDGKSIGEGLETRVQMFLDEYAKFRTAFPTSAQQWFIDIDGYVAYTSEDIVTIVIKTDAYTGGAHGFNSIDYLMFSTETGARLGINDIVRDRNEIESLAETTFRRMMKLGPDDDLQAAGYWFKDNIFSITDNAGMTEDGLVFQYNPYEIASYAEGAIEVVLSAEELGDMLISPRQ